MVASLDFYKDVVAFAKKNDIVVLSDLTTEVIFPLLLERLNIFTDPQRPMTVADFDAKAGDCFRVAARPFPADAAMRLRQCVDRLETLADARVLVAALDPAAPHS